MDTVQISMSLICTVNQDATDLWVAGCPALDVFSQGKTEEEAKRCLQEAIGLWVEDCLERGTLDQALHEVGFNRVHQGTIDSENTPVSSARNAPPAANTFLLQISIPVYKAAA